MIRYGWFRGLPFAHHGSIDRLCQWIAWKLPRRLVAWCVIRVWANATTGEFRYEEAPAMLMDLSLGRWDQRRGGDFRK